MAKQRLQVVSMPVKAFIAALLATALTFLAPGYAIVITVPITVWLAIMFRRLKRQHGRVVVGMCLGVSALLTALAIAIPVVWYSPTEPVPVQMD